MKTLYIDINNEQIESNDELEVLNHDLGSDFFFYLGERIAKGCKVSNENTLITDFNTPDNKQDFDSILSQWDEVKRILFGECIEGTFEFELPSGYLHWLRYNEDYNHVYEANCSNGNGRTITIDLEELYEDTIEDLQRKIMRKLKRDDLYLDIDEIVFNDEDVSRKSLIVRAIKEKYEGIGFKSYKKWAQEHELESVERAKADINKSNTNSISSNDFFPYKGISLGETYVNSVDGDKIDEEDNRVFYKIDRNVYFVGIKGYPYFLALAVATDVVDEKLPQNWNDILGCEFDAAYEECYKSLVDKGFVITHREKDIIAAITPGQKYRVFLKFQERTPFQKFSRLFINEGLYTMRFDEFLLTLNRCPYCNSTKFELKNLGNEGFFPFCADCNRPYFPLPSEDISNADDDSEDEGTPYCPSCSSHDVDDDGSNYLQYTCNDCGHNWGHDDTVECPECGSDDVENDGTDYLQYECNACGHVWGGDEDEEDYYADDTDNAGNPLSEYYESFDVIVGKSTKLDVQRKGGKLINSDYGEYKMPNGVKVYFFNDSHTVNHITIHKEAMNSIPEFYKKIGIYWGMNKYEFRKVFENLGFSVREYKSDCQDTISAYKQCEKYNKCFYVEIGYVEFLGMFNFDFSEI